MNTYRSILPAFLVSWFGLASIQAQYVNVTLSLDTNKLSVGSTTILHCYAQVAPEFRLTADRIFSWYVDLVNGNGALASFNSASIAKPTSDRDPKTSGNGQADGSNLRGIYDTFLNLTGAGRDAPVELFSIPVKAMAAGQATFRVQPGTGVSSLAADFLVAPTGGGDPLIGGTYTAASVSLEITGNAQAETRLSIARTVLPNKQVQINITYPLTAGRTYFVESRDGMSPSFLWQTLPNGPHNSGMVTETNVRPQRVYRLRMTQ